MWSHVCLVISLEMHNPGERHGYLDGAVGNETRDPETVIHLACGILGTMHHFPLSLSSRGACGGRGATGGPPHSVCVVTLHRVLFDPLCCHAPGLLCSVVEQHPCSITRTPPLNSYCFALSYLVPVLTPGCTPAWGGWTGLLIHGPLGRTPPRGGQPQHARHTHTHTPAHNL